MTASDGLVSIIVPAYKAERFVRRCMESILAQTYRNLEVIVVYDESPDNTLQLLEEYNQRIIIMKQSKTSPSIARNTGIRVARGEYIAFCDIDDTYESGKVDAEVSALSSNPEIDLVYTDIAIVEEGSRAQRQSIPVPEWNRDTWLRNRFIAFSSIMVRRSLIEFIQARDGYVFDERLPAFDDFDFLIRASAHAKFKKVPPTLTNIYIHSDNLSRHVSKMNRIRARILLRNRMISYHSYCAILARDWVFSTLRRGGRE